MKKFIKRHEFGCKIVLWLLIMFVLCMIWGLVIDNFGGDKPPIIIVK